MVGMSASMSEMVPNQHKQNHRNAGGGGIADPSTHRLPSRMPDVNGIDKWVTHQAANKADHAVCRQHPRGWKFVAGNCSAFHVIERFDKIVNSERNRRDEDHTEEFKAGEHMAERRQSALRKPKLATASVKAFETHAAIVQAHSASNPRRSSVPTAIATKPAGNATDT